MLITVSRFSLGDKATIGKMTVDNSNFACFTLELVDRELTLQTPLTDIAHTKQLYPHETAIPTGQYEVVMAFSPRFNKQMPHLVNVPGFQDIMIHNGNTDASTEGCILIGMTKVNNDFVGESVAALGELWPLIYNASKVEKVYISIVKAPQTA